MSVGGSAEVFIPLQLKRLDFHVVTERPTEQKRPNFPVPLFMLVFRSCLVRAVPFKRARELYCPPPFPGVLRRFIPVGLHICKRSENAR